MTDRTFEFDGTTYELPYRQSSGRKKHIIHPGSLEIYFANLLLLGRHSSNSLATLRERFGFSEIGYDNDAPESTYTPALKMLGALPFIQEHPKGPRRLVVKSTATFIDDRVS